MSKDLLIVESPTKVKTISKFVGKELRIKATFGHIKDLPKTKLGVDIENGFSPTFVIIKSKQQALEEIKKAAEKARRILIGSDPDREGEAIAFHVAEEINGNREIKRVLFHEITRKGVLEALKDPRDLDEARYSAQKTRRILDRIVGYMISPLLWEKVKYGLSAGRVQSAALRIVCDREEERERFVSEEYFVLEAEFQLESGSLRASFEDEEGKKKIKSLLEAQSLKEELSRLSYHVEAVEAKRTKIHPKPPFITSTLQQEASRRLRFSPEKTMRLAQRLYEGVDIKGMGYTGLVTYIRTDSVRLAEEAVASARTYIKKVYGNTFLPEKPFFYKNRRTAQDAHEAIRPTRMDLPPNKVKGLMERDLFLLYELIWKRFVASQMKEKEVETEAIRIVSENGDVFVARGQRVIFEGFSILYEEADEEEKTQGLPSVRRGEVAQLKDIVVEKRSTEPPPRYTEASLIKTLEARGIGRPSTYATILSTIEKREYVKKERGKLIPTPLGRKVNELLKRHFPTIVDLEFTAKLEEDLDLIESGDGDWRKSLAAFYEAFKKDLLAAKEAMENLKRKEEETEVLCDRCGRRMVLRWGRNGEYLVCSGKPSCPNKKDVKVKEDGSLEIINREKKGTCRVCGAGLVERSGRFGRFLACERYPACTYTEAFCLPYGCPQEGCNGRLVERVSKGNKRYFSCSSYPTCRFTTRFTPKEGPCPSCGARTLFTSRRKDFCLRKGCGWKSK